LKQSAAAQKVYLQVVEDVLQWIAEHGLQRDDPLPTMREMTVEFEAGLGAVKRALHELREAGVIYSRQGIGSYVLDPDARPAVGGAARAAALEEELRSLSDRTQALEEILRKHLPEVNVREAAVT
jgi:DNA-binding GntR family transcriptional regulator